MSSKTKHPTNWQLLTFHLQEIIDELLKYNYRLNELQKRAIITALETQLEILYDDDKH